MYTYTTDLFSDLHKDVYGYRPRGEAMEDWNSRTPRQKNELYNALCDELEEITQDDARRGARNVFEFTGEIMDMIELGAKDRETALRWDKQARSEQRISARLNPDGEADWIIEPIKQDLMQADPCLNQLHEQSISQRGFGNLCTLYVAMTRAKRGLYMISDFDRVAKASTVHYLRERLGRDAQPTELFPASNYPVLWRCGDPNWHASFQADAAKPARQAPPPAPHFAAAHPRLQLARPSSAHAFTLAAGSLFDLRQQASDFGTKVHDAFEQIEWLERAECDAEPAVKQTLEQCFANSAIRALFTAPQSASLVWRERAFSYVDGEQFINGVFDRVVIHQDDRGQITAAHIIDFKTDRIHPANTLQQATARHRPQLEVYRTALSKIIGIDASLIELHLLFTHVPQLVQL